ncbi:transcription factor hoxa13 [Aspergillus costaricaensis CBS 115574]|uniref:Transcription factor hoxa13 n=1 Tax=Aspergillus costaricaensis CBS 115574 TaxID=1448317 RepID=A0ACD1I3X4_9EURO|nr:transcription factor hoxa13 [Aspergillus costaricaensis CBS 115574]RAK85066.1 transcription factor hoxa13 [Aspergillus costaricaensis CBS 115574]
MMTVPDNSHAPDGADRIIKSRSSASKPSKRGTIRWTVGLVVRLCIWYALLTPFLRCPSQLSDLTDSSPRVCKPYLVARSYVEPHVMPYYNAYGAPYVETARPYVQVLNEKVYAPTSRVVKHGYERFGAPALDKAQLYGQQQWETIVVPQLQSAKDRANGLYQSQLYPHVQTVEAALSPSFQKANGAIKFAYGDYLLPFGAKYRPFIGKTYTTGQEILTTTVLPYAQNSWSAAIYFIHSTLWPRVTGVYSQNVEPQLVKIGERLASYREEKRLRQVAEEVESASQQASFLTAPKATEVNDLTTSSITEQATATPTLSPTEQAAKARNSIETDLRTWQQKFAVAAEKGLEDLEERLQEIVDGFIGSGVRAHGESLATALEAVVDNELIALKRHINNLAESLPKEDVPQEEQAATNELFGNIKEAAVSIRDRAHALREWRHSFDQELTRRVSFAINSTLDVLDSVRDLGLQEVGMRWAWMDGVTYKDWARYHALKAQFEEWKDEFLEFGLQHAKLEEARAVADEILSHGMEVAEAAAKELTRLRDVGKWKIAAREASDDFDTRSEPPPSLPKPSRAPEPVVDEEGLADESADAERPDGTVFAYDAASRAVNDGSDGDEESMADDEEHASPQANGGLPSEYESTSPLGDNQDADYLKAAWGVAAADVRTPSEGETPQASGPQLSAEQQQAVAALISGLLVDKDSAYAEEIMNKLHSIYGTPAPTPEPSVAFDDASDEVSDFDAEAANAPFPESEEPIDETDEASNASSEADFESSAIVDDEDNNEEVQDTPESLSEDIDIDGVEEGSPMDDVESSSATLASTASSVVSEAEETIIPETTPASGDNSAEEL